MSDRIDFDRLTRDEATIVGVVSRYFPLIQRGSRWIVPKGEDGDSVSVYQRPDGHWKFHRWSQDQYGDVLDVLKFYEPGVVTTEDALRALDAMPPPPPRPIRRAAPSIQQAPEWDAHGLLWEYETHPQREVAWRGYKPLPVESLDKWHCGVGRLPGISELTCNHPRLVYLVIEEGQLVGVRGRSMLRQCEAECPKWLSSKGSTKHLWGWDLVNREHCRGKVLVIVENPCDAMLLMVGESVVAVASTAGAHAWMPDWSDRIAEAQPDMVLVMLDNDLAGMPNAQVWRSERQAYISKHGREPSPPAGPKIMADILRHPSMKGKVLPYTWPPGTPVHYDAGSSYLKGWRIA